MKKDIDLSALKKRISRKSSYDKFEMADKELGLDKQPDEREKVIRRSYALTKDDLEHINLIREKLFKKKKVVSDSHIIRTALCLSADSSEDELLKASSKTPKVLMGRPRK